MSPDPSQLLFENSNHMRYKINRDLSRLLRNGKIFWNTQNKAHRGLYYTNTYRLKYKYVQSESLRHIATWTWANIRSGNGLLPDHARKPYSPFSAKILPFSAKTPVLGKISPFAVQSSRYPHVIFSIEINEAKEKYIVFEISGRFVNKFALSGPLYII